MILGLAGERVVRSYRFLATFQDTTEWAIKEEGRDIGTIASPVPTGERFALAGRTWEVVDVVSEQRVVLVKRVKGSVRTLFVGGHGGDVHDRIVERMRRVLEEDATYPYLTEHASTRLGEARQLAREVGLCSGPVIMRLGDHRVAVVPWAGTRVVRTIALQISRAGFAAVTNEGPYLLLTTRDDDGADAIARGLSAIVADTWDIATLVTDLGRALCMRGKYDEFLPDGLLRRSFAASSLDPEGAATRLRAALVARPAQPK